MVRGFADDADQDKRREKVIVRIEHLRELRYCARGVRAFFARHGLDYVEFLKRGIDAETLLHASNNDAMALAAVEVARGRQ